MTPAIHLHQLYKSFSSDRVALKAIDLTIQQGEMVALIGASGSGKSTLLRIMAGLLKADPQPQCKVEILGQVLQERGVLARNIRQQRAQIGFIFQQFNLVNRLSVFLNVLLGTLGRISRWRGLLGLFTKEDNYRAMQALQRVGMADKASQRASTLSGGQQQRVAIARALVQQPALVFADEPIASLDPEASRVVMEALTTLNQDGITVVVSLHQVDYAIRYCQRTVALKEGQIVYDGASSALTPERLNELYGATAAVDLLPPESALATNGVMPNEPPASFLLRAALSA